MVDVDIVGAQALQAGLDGIDQMVAGRTLVVRAIAHGKCGLGRDQQILPLALNRLAEDLLRETFRIHIRGIEKVDACVEAETDEALRLLNVGCAPGTEKFGTAAKCSDAEAQDGNLQTGAAKQTI